LGLLGQQSSFTNRVSYYFYQRAKRPNTIHFKALWGTADHETPQAYLPTPPSSVPPKSPGRTGLVSADAWQTSSTLPPIVIPGRRHFRSRGSTSPSDRPHQRRRLNQEQDSDDADLEEGEDQSNNHDQLAEGLSYRMDGQQIPERGRRPREPGHVGPVAAAHSAGHGVAGRRRLRPRPRRDSPRGAGGRLRGLRPAPAAPLDSDEEQEGDEEIEDEFRPAIENMSPSNQSAAADPVSEQQSLPNRAHHFMLAISMVCENVVENSEDSSYVSEVFQSLSEGTDLSSTVPSVMATDSLENLAMRCILAEDTAACLDFVYMLNCIQLRCKIIR